MFSGTTARPWSLLMDPIAPPPARLLTREAAMALGTKLLSMVSDRSVGILLEHTARSVTAAANGRILTNQDGDELSITFQSKFGSGLPVVIGTDQMDDTTLRRVVAQAKALAPPVPRPEDTERDDPDDQKYFTYNRRDYLPVTLWHDRTITAMDKVPGEIIPPLLDQIAAANLTGAATVGLAARATLYLYQPGLTAWAQETDCELTVTARTQDGTASGWSGQANRDWGVIDPNMAAAEAIDFAQRGRNAVAIEPGQRTTILGPAAVAQLVRLMANMFDAFLTNTGATPFSLSAPDAKRNKLGLQVCDPRITFVSDPADPDGGYPPFFEAGSGGIPGLPIPKMTWIEGGVLKNLAYGVSYALAEGKPWCDVPMSVRLSPTPETTTATIEEMISSCKEGVYVNRFSNVSLVDRSSGLMTGLTRDGCFFVKDGKIDRPIKNFRFVESPIFMFNKLRMIGVARRAAFGYTPPADTDEYGHFAQWPPLGRFTRWPRIPIIVPPMMVEDFNFVSLADAV